MDVLARYVLRGRFHESFACMEYMTIYGPINRDAFSRICDSMFRFVAFDETLGRMHIGTSSESIVAIVEFDEHDNAQVTGFKYRGHHLQQYVANCLWTVSVQCGASGRYMEYYDCIDRTPSPNVHFLKQASTHSKR